MPQTASNIRITLGEYACQFSTLARDKQCADSPRFHHEGSFRHGCVHGDCAHVPTAVAHSTCHCPRLEQRQSLLHVFENPV